MRSGLCSLWSLLRGPTSAARVARRPSDRGAVCPRYAAADRVRGPRASCAETSKLPGQARQKFIPNFSAACARRGGPRSFREGSRVARRGGDRPSSKIFSRLRQPAGRPVVHRVVTRLAQRDQIPLAPGIFREVFSRPDVVRGRRLFPASEPLRPLAPVSGLPQHALAQPAPARTGIRKAGVLSASAVPGLRRHALRSLFLISVVYSLRQRGHQTGRFSASVSAVIRWSFFLQVGQVIHPSWLATSISFFTP